MKLSISKTELNHAIQHVSKAISNRTTIPILSGIKMDVTHQGVTLTASDAEIAIQSFIPIEHDAHTIVEIERLGTVVLPAKFFVEIIKKLPAPFIEIETKERFQTFLRAGTTDIQIIGLDPEQFPVLPDIEESKSVTLNGNLLRTMIKQTIFSTASNEMTPILTGVLWNLSDGILKFVATDRHRLASRVAHIQVAPELEFNNVVIPGKTLNELSKIIPDTNKSIQIVVANNQILFKIDHVLFYSCLLDGMFPDTAKIIPQQYKTELILDAKQLLDALDRAYLLSREEKTNIVRLRTKEDGTIEISSSSSELGHVQEQLEVKECNGEPLRIAFNSKYMLDVLKVIDCDHVFIGFTGAVSPIIIKPNEDIGSLHLILPYRTTN